MDDLPLIPNPSPGTCPDPDRREGEGSAGRREPVIFRRDEGVSIFGLALVYRPPAEPWRPGFAQVMRPPQGAAGNDRVNMQSAALTEKTAPLE